MSGNTRELASFITDKPLEFEFDPDTGVLSLIFLPRLESRGCQVLERSMRLMLTPEASLSLLTDLPQLEGILAQATKGPIKVRSVQ